MSVRFEIRSTHSPRVTLVYSPPPPAFAAGPSAARSFPEPSSGPRAPPQPPCAAQSRSGFFSYTRRSLRGSPARHRCHLGEHFELHNTLSLPCRPPLDSWFVLLPLLLYNSTSARGGQPLSPATLRATDHYCGASIYRFRFAIAPVFWPATGRASMVLYCHQDRKNSMLARHATNAHHTPHS